MEEAAYKKLQTRAAAIDKRLDSLKGSTAVLRTQFQQAVEELQSKYGIAPEQVDQTLVEATAEIDQLQTELESKLNEYELLSERVEV